MKEGRILLVASEDIKKGDIIIHTIVDVDKLKKDKEGNIILTGEAINMLYLSDKVIKDCYLKGT